MWGNSSKISWCLERYPINPNSHVLARGGGPSKHREGGAAFDKLRLQTMWVWLSQCVSTGTQYGAFCVLEDGEEEGEMPYLRLTPHALHPRINFKTSYINLLLKKKCSLTLSS